MRGAEINALEEFRQQLSLRLLQTVDLVHVDPTGAGHARLAIGI